MICLRKHLRLWTSAWLVCQIATYSALLPRDCCAAHAHRAKPVEAAQESPDGATCAMHHAEPDPKPVEECSWRGTCGGPLSALAALFAHQGILPASVVVARETPSAALSVQPRERAASHLIQPDPQPPRA
jgi:hypothetical protein